MDYCKGLQSSNKFEQRASLRDLLQKIEENQICSDDFVTICKSLPYTANYDTCRELSFRLLSAILFISREKDVDEVQYLAFDAIKVNVDKRGENEMEEVRIQVSFALHGVLSSADNEFCKKTVDDVLKILRLYCTDKCPTVVQNTLEGLQRYIQNSSIHMIEEGLVYALIPCLNHKQHAIRLTALQQIHSLFRMEGDRNGIVFDNTCEDILRLLRDSNSAVQSEVMIMIKYFLTHEEYSRHRISLLQSIKTTSPVTDANEKLKEEILETPL